MEIRQVTNLATLEDYVAVESVAYAHDYELMPSEPVEELAPVVEGHQPPSEHTTLWLGVDDGEPVAAMTTTITVLDNLDSGNLELHVLPSARSRGVGRATLRRGLDELRSAGRSKAFLNAAWGPDRTPTAGVGLLRSIGAKPVLDDVRRIVDLQTHPASDLPPVPAGYRLVQWLDVAPEEVVDGLAYLLYRMVLDAPMGEMDYGPESWDAKRVRANEHSAALRHRTRIATVAVDERTGQVAGMTDIMANRGRPEVAAQWSTIVDPEHRGHGLGYVLKCWNHAQLVAAVPGARWVNTWNAASNSYMIAVNDRLGYRPCEEWTEWQLAL